MRTSMIALLIIGIILISTGIAGIMITLAMGWKWGILIASLGSIVIGAFDITMSADYIQIKNF